MPAELWPAWQSENMATNSAILSHPCLCWRVFLFLLLSFLREVSLFVSSVSSSRRPIKQHTKNELYESVARAVSTRKTHSWTCQEDCLL